jgi:hypothetical protein
MDCFSQLLFQSQKDYSNYYPSQSFYSVGSLIGVSGIIAYSRIDRDVRNWWQTDVRSAFSNEISRSSFSNVRQEGLLLIPFYALSYCLSQNAYTNSFEQKVNQWSGYNLRSLALGVPQQVFLTHLMGGKRPTESTDPRWHPFQKGYNRGVSGHAFYGAIPFLNAAKVTEHPLGKIAWYILSTLPAWGRIEKDKHYLSQVVAGYGLAYIMTEFVSSEERDKASHWGFYPRNEGVMLSLHHYF